MTLSISNITKSFGYYQVLNGISFTVNIGERIGLVGANGVGKSTLLKIISGELEADDGEIRLTPGAKIGYLAQVIKNVEDQSVADLIADALSDVNALEAQMRDLEALMAEAKRDVVDTLIAAYGAVTEQFERRGGYDLDYRLEIIMTGLGVGHIDHERDFITLSGGEKSRFGLALLLLKAPDILLLDEPTNHLDDPMLVWLERYLQAYAGAILIVSHDRLFLNKTATAIVEIDEYTRLAKRYSGNYDSYHAAQIQEHRQWEANYAAQQEEIKSLRYALKVSARQNSNDRKSHRTENDKFMRHDYIASHEKTVSKRVRSTEERLKRIEADPIPEPPGKMRFKADFDPQLFRGKVPLVVSGINKSFGERCVLRDIHFSLETNSRVVLVGPNGAGKSTLLKIIMGLLPPDSGEVHISPAVDVGFLHQEQGAFDPRRTLFEAYQAGMDRNEQQLKAIVLSSGLFRYDDLQKRVDDLSSGQERKIQIARLMAGQANMLILDEPTNYISLDVLEEFEQALQSFSGPILAASHDRRFMQQLGGQIWELRDGALIKYLEGYTEYMAEMMRI